LTPSTPHDSLMSTLESLLKMNGATMILENGAYKIVPGAVTRGSISPRFGGKLSGYSIQIVPLQYYSGPLIQDSCLSYALS
jgi:hypothetical protein